MRPAVELSYLTANEQKTLYETIESEDRTPSHAQAIRLRELTKLGKLGDNAIFAIMIEEQSNEKPHIELHRGTVKDSFRRERPKKKLDQRLLKRWRNTENGSRQRNAEKQNRPAKGELRPFFVKWLALSPPAHTPPQVKTNNY